MDNLLINAMKHIAALSKPEIFEIDGKQLSSKTLYPIIHDEPVPEHLIVNTLTGLVDYIESSKDDCFDLEKSIIHIVDHQTVSLFSGTFGKKHQRLEHVISIATNLMKKGYMFGHPQSIESFIISLQSDFIKTDESVKLGQFVSGIKVSAKAEFKDTGYSQIVTAQKGVSLVEEVEVPNPVILQPIRTFLDVIQPESSFVFRLTASDEKRGVLCSLHEAGGGSWKLTAIQNIKDWLVKKLPKTATIIA